MKTKFLLSLLLGLIIHTPMILAQCIDGDHSIWKDSWASCQSTPNPNPQRSSGHWILYDFGQNYFLSKTRIWNTNEIGKLNVGFRKVAIDFSEDGQNWESLGIFEFPKAEGNARYAGFPGPDFDRRPARYVLLSAISNWGDATCYGIAEIKFHLTSISSVPETNPPSVPLPVELLSFEAQRVGEKDVRLDWQTASEENSDYFEVLKSTDASNWQSIGTVAAAGFSSSNLEYELIDPNAFDQARPSQILYYRLQQFDRDGTSSFSSIRAVQAHASDLSTPIQLYPNPTTGQLYLIDRSPVTRSYRMEIYNELGQVVKRAIYSSDDRSIDVSALLPGYYSISLIEGTSTQHFKFIKI